MNQEPATSPMKKWKLFLLAFVGWSLGGVLWSVYFYFRTTMLGDAAAFPRWIVAGLVVFLFWLVVTPLIRWIANRIPLDRGKRLKHGLYHLGLAIVFFFLHSGWLVIVAPTSYMLFGWESWSQYWSNLRLTELFLNIRGPVDFVIYWGIVPAHHAMRYYQQYRERDLRASQLEAQLAQAQLATLRMHIQPHFLFNTLHSIVALIQQDNRPGAIKMAVGLSDLLRRVLSDSNRHEATLREEIIFLRQYLEIEQTRFQDRLTVTFEIDSDTEAAYVPTLVLQPLVENALRHGIAKQPGPGEISISAHRDDTSLTIKVIDNGTGVADSPDPAGQGVGLRVTRERLRQMYGERWELRLERIDGIGTQAMVRLPYLTAPLTAGEASEHVISD